MLREAIKTQDAAGTRFWRYGPVVVWMALIWFASTSEFSAANSSRFVRPIVLWLFPNISESHLQLVHMVVRKAAHFGEYAVFGLLAARALSSSSRKLLRIYWFPASLLLIVIYALIDEYHQSFISSRTSSFYDSGIDVAGGFFAIMLFTMVLKRRRQAKHPGR